jgi:hypothetical protein
MAPSALIVWLSLLWIQKRLLLLAHPHFATATIAFPGWWLCRRATVAAVSESTKETATRSENTAIPPRSANAALRV